MSETEGTIPAPTGATPYECTVLWCIEEKCRGEHTGDACEPVAATGGSWRWSKYGGVNFPTVDVRLVWNEVEHMRPSVRLWIHGEDIDQEADLLLHESKALLLELERAVRALDESMECAGEVLRYERPEGMTDAQWAWLREQWTAMFDEGKTVPEMLADLRAELASIRAQVEAAEEVTSQQ